MIQRLSALTRYLLRRLVFSVAGLLYMLGAFAYWLIFFNPRSGRTPEADYFILLLAIFGAVLAFLTTLSVGARGNRAESYPLVVRLPSRIEFLAATLFSALLFVVLTQWILALVILLLPGGPEIGLGRLLFEAPPIWLALDIFAAVLALHATDLVMEGWSRVYVYGVLTVLLFGQSLDARSAYWIAERFNGLAGRAAVRGWLGLADRFSAGANWISQNGLALVQNTLGFVFWPFAAISAAAQAGSYNNAQALAPAILLLYATILFLLAADLFAGKDLQLLE